ncbi:proline dehydrogenase family protein [Arenibacter sp. ARW7G5Y1]|uniref:proline dehydrogenase family protein n=1 Tax=Arenibacter sp. ARW7G5Y1 TaxID=2135619 RepID=UPI000D773048|nr:proline dehydrogenase family protein [Arenibacter sp. ARW7G5Y1]PXX21382.1 L-proline dehydrogenase [Arenibacter sp. ARW7G5Y1]
MEERLLRIGAESLKKAALNENAKEFILKNEILFKVLKKAADRYIGGETINETLLSVRKWNQKGFDVTTDFMGESIRNKKDANLATTEFVQFTKAIGNKKLNSSISLDLSHIGLLVSKDLAMENLKIICEEASKINQEVIISMEGTDRTDNILYVYRESLKTHKNLGITIQAYLHRSKDDFEEISKLTGSIRMVKGAYETPNGLSIERGDKLDEIYLNYVERLLSKNHKCSIASHHDKIHQETIKLIDKYKPSNYVLERLLGIRNEELEQYKNKGYNSRIYVVYGKEWYLYLCNRWAEYPLNIFQGIADIVE